MMKKIVLVIVIGLLLLSVWLIITMRKNDRLAALDNFSQAVIGSEKVDDQGDIVVTPELFLGLSKIDKN